MFHTIVKENTCKSCGNYSQIKFNETAQLLTFAFGIHTVMRTLQIIKQCARNVAFSNGNLMFLYDTR